MNIALLAPAVEPIPPVKYGGIELVVYNIAEELIRLGHSVTLLASGDSKTNATLIPIFPRALRTYPEAKDFEWQHEMKEIARVASAKYLMENKFDIIHSHLDSKFLPYARLIQTPIVTTIHGYPANMGQVGVYNMYKDEAFISISMSQRKSLPDINFVANVYNGIEVDKFQYSETGGDYLAFLGRISPEKGPEQAILAAKQAGMKLKMAAKIDAVDVDYYERTIKPLIDGTQIEFIGEVDHAGKVELLKNAKALVTPIQWDEPFGLVMAEAMACGTPVVVVDRGSAREVVDDGVTGFIVKNSIDALAQAIGKIGAIDRSACRKRCEENFSSTRMVENYLAVYQEVISKA